MRRGMFEPYAKLCAGPLYGRGSKGIHTGIFRIYFYKKDGVDYVTNN